MAANRFVHTITEEYCNILGTTLFVKVMTIFVGHYLGQGQT